MIDKLAYYFHYAQACTQPLGIKIPCRSTSDDSPIEAVFKIVVGVIAALCVLFITIGGFRYTVSNGDPTNISKAKNTIIYALIGLLVTVTAYGIISVVISRVGG